MPINASPHYLKAESEYLQAETTEKKIACLKKMIILAPKHKGSENLLKQLKTRLKKLKYSKEKEKKSGRSSFKGIKKEDLQVVLIGKTNAGKSSLLSALTNANPEVADYRFTTKEPLVAILKYGGTNIQIIENPAINSPYYDLGIPHTADILLLTVENIKEIPEILEETSKHPGKKIVVFTKSDKLSNEQKRKISETLRSKKIDFVIISVEKEEGIEELKEKIFSNFGKIRIFTKEPGKEPDRNRPLILLPNSTVKIAAEKVLKKGIKLKEARITGPSSKFPNQKVGPSHTLKDLDIVEFRT
jgi:uncharacterized protein